MKMMIDFALEVNIEGDRVNANEIFRAVKETMAPVTEQIALKERINLQGRCQMELVSCDRRVA